MKIKTDLKINLNHFSKSLIYVQFIYVCIVRLLVEVGFPDSITLICDMINVVLLVSMVIHYMNIKEGLELCRGYILISILFFVLGTFSALLYGFHAVQWLWSVRNFGRFGAFFIACCAFLEKKDLIRIKRIFYYLSHINFILAIFQFFILHKSGDYIGGLFGTTGGTANTWMNVFLVVVAITQLSEWLVAPKGKTSHLVVALIEGIGIAIIAELKFYFIEIALLTAVGVILANKTRKIFEKLLIIICFGVVALSISAPLLYKLFPNFENFFSLEVIIRTATSSYTGTGDLGRATAIFEIAEKIFKYDFFKVLFGIGLGNGEYSGGHAILQSEFYVQYMYTNYFWFSDAVVMIQNGLIGIILYVFSICSLIRKSIFKFYRSKHWCEMELGGVLTVLAGIMLFVYNISLNTESAYIYYLLLSFCVISRKRNRKEMK